MSKAIAGDKVEASVTRPADVREGRRIKGIYTVEHWRDGRLLSTEVSENVCTDEGLDALLDIMFHADTQITTWYCVISESSDAADVGMTYASPTFTECTAYTGNRPAYDEAAASSQVTTNTASKAAFPMTDTKTIYGGGLVGGGSAPDTKGNTAGGGTLFSYSKFTSSKSVVNGDTLNLTIELTLADT